MTCEGNTKIEIGRVLLQKLYNFEKKLEYSYLDDYILLSLKMSPFSHSSVSHETHTHGLSALPISETNYCLKKHAERTTLKLVLKKVKYD